MLSVLKLRVEGKSPDEIIDEFSDKFGMYIHKGDLISWLDQMVRYLEAIEAVAKVLGKTEVAREAAERKRKVEGE